MTRRTVYVAAPYDAPDARHRAHNVLRASALVSMLHREGRAPICVHSLVEAGAYGDDADPEARAKGLETAVALAVACLDLFALERDDRSRSAGVEAEVSAWLRALPPAQPPAGTTQGEFTSHRWADLRARMEAVGLGDVWARLRIGPDVAGPWVEDDAGKKRWFGGTPWASFLAARVELTASHGDNFAWEAMSELGEEVAEGNYGTGLALTEADAMAAADAWLRAHGVEVDDG